jgi:hypothetical protein
VIFDTDQECRIATTQEASSTGEAGSPKLALEQRLDDAVGIFVLYHCDHQLHRLRSYSSADQSNAV